MESLDSSTVGDVVATGTGIVPPATNETTSVVQLQLPQFWPHNLALWFTQVEAAHPDTPCDHFKAVVLTRDSFRVQAPSTAAS